MSSKSVSWTLHVVLSCLVLGTWNSCSGEPPVIPSGDSQPVNPLEIVAASSAQWTGIAVSNENRMFVNYPRWRQNLVGSVSEIRSDGSTPFYPSDNWNDWSEGNTDYQHKFICVQSVYVDDENFLWVLDTGNPFLQGVLAGAPKLVKVDLATNAVVRIYPFESTMLDPACYLNDVRIDTRTRTAYISESGLGAILVMDLTTGVGRMLLDDHLSTTAQEISVTVEGRLISSRIHCDGIALSRDRNYLYFKPLTGRRLYRIETRYLRDTTLTSADVEARVEFVAQVGVSDGMEFGYDGSLYITSLEDNSIKRLTPQNVLETVVQGARIKWPDSIYIAKDNTMYFTTSQVHLGGNVTDPNFVCKNHEWVS